MEYPRDVKNFEDTIYNICGITSIESGICKLDEIDSELLLTVDYTHLPIATLLRTKGGLKNELLASLDLRLNNQIEVCKH